MATTYIAIATVSFMEAGLAQAVPVVDLLILHQLLTQQAQLQIVLVVALSIFLIMLEVIIKI